MIERRTTKAVIASVMATILICAAVSGSYFENEKKEIAEMETINVSNMLYNYVDAMDAYGSNLQIITFEKKDPVYAYKLHESLGRMKAGSDALSRETYGEALSDGLSQSLRELSRQLSNFTYRFMRTYPYESPEMDVAVLEMARAVSSAANIFDIILKTSDSEPWVLNPAKKDEWMVDKGYRIEGKSAELFIMEIEALIEENEKLMQCMEWE